MGGFAWVTLATNDSYSLGAMVLAHSLKQVGTAHQLAVLITPGVTSVMREKLGTVFNVVKEVNILDSRDEANLRLLKRPELGITFTKLHCWRLTQFEKCVFLDADTMVLANADELFDREEFSAAPDVGWPDCFNSGVFVYRPSEETYGKLIQFAIDKGSFDGGDQGLLNLYFSDWAHKDISKHLPFIYNMCSTACYSYLPAFKQFGPNVKIIHFIGNTKPWLQYFDSESQHVQVISDIKHLQEVVQQWWNIFCSCIHPMLSPEMPTSRAPSTIHYPSNPNFGHTFHHNSAPDYSLFNIDENKSDYRNVFDPWEEYENKFDNPSHQEEHTDCVPHFENNSVDTVVHNVTESHHYNHTHHSTDRLDHNVAIDVFRHSSNNDNFNNDNYTIPRTPNCNEETRFDCNISSDTHEFDFSNNHSSNHSHIEPSLQPPSPEINTSSTTTDPALECNQLARPHECEPTSSVTNENALHDHVNEVHDGSAGLAGAFARLTMGVARTPEQVMIEDQLRRQGWEVGNIDYMGRDSFDNIWSKICETMSSGSPAQSYSPPPPAEPIPTAVDEPVVAKQAVSETAQQPITTTSEQKTVVEKEQSELIAANVTLSESVTPSSPKIVSVPTVVPIPQSSAPVTQPAVSVSQPVVSTPQPVVTASQPAIPRPQPPVSAPEPAVSAPQPPVLAPQPPIPVPQPPAPQPPAPVTQPPVRAPQPIVPIPQPSTPAAQPAAPIAPSSPQISTGPKSVLISQTVSPPSQLPASPIKPAVSDPQPAKVATPKPITPAPAPQPEPPRQVNPPEKKISTPESPKPVSEPTKPQVTQSQATPKPPVLSDPPKKQPESPKPVPPPAVKPKTPQTAESLKTATEPPKPSVNIAKPATEQAAGQKAAPQSPPPKEVVQTKPESPSAEGPTPPPRKGASAQAAAGAKKPAKGKK